MSGKWFSQDPRSQEWSPYDAADSKALEKSWNSDKKLVKLDFCGQTFTVDLKKMVQTNASGGSRRVRRDALAAPTAAMTNFVNGMTADGLLTLDQLAEFCQALGVDAATAQPFVLFYKFGVQGCWQATSEELLTGFSQHGLEPTPKAVSAALQKWTSAIATDYSEFAAFADFAFKFCRPTPSAKAISWEDWKEPMTVVLGVHKAKFTFKNVDGFMAFLDKKNKPVSNDLWKQSVRFLHEIKPDCSNFDADDCWNTVLDDFVEACTSSQ